MKRFNRMVALESGTGANFNLGLLQSREFQGGWPAGF